jgi:hypothetical protein
VANPKWFTDHPASTLTAAEYNAAHRGHFLNFDRAGRVMGLKGTNNVANPNTQFDVTADFIEFRPPTGDNVVVSQTSTLTCNLSTAGPAANGRDQAGAFSPNSWVHLYVIGKVETNGTITRATTFSIVAPPTGPTLPTGYTHWAYATTLRLNASTQLQPVFVRGCWVYYKSFSVQVANGTSTTETASSTVNLVPPNALKVQIDSTVSVTAGGSAGEAQFVIRVLSGSNFYSGRAYSPVAGAIVNATGGSCIIPNVNQNLYWLLVHAGSVSASQGVLNILGYCVANGDV